MHFGPANSPGGMATVIKTLNRNPPEGWELELSNSWFFAPWHNKVGLSP